MIRRRTLLSLTAFTSLLLGACSSGASNGVATNPPTTPADVTSPSETTQVPPSSTPDTGSPSSSAPPATEATTVPPRRACTPPSTAPLSAAPADATGQEWSITSFDGTVIRAHWFPLPGLATGATAPTVLMGPGWGSAGDTNTAPSTDPGQLGIAGLHAAGFNVLTWDPRGFGLSTGTIEIDSAEFEGRDVEQLLDWVSTLPQVELDGDRDPRVGMFGASYGGGIQLVTAAIDCRIDAIVPIIAWHSLQSSLFKADTPKTGWANFLSAASAGRQLDPTIVRANAAGNANGIIDPADTAWFAGRGPGDAVGQIQVPTLIIQGTVDTLFTLDEAVSNLHALPPGVPSAMLWFCGGHGACLTDPGDESRTSTAALNWLRRYVAGDTTVDVGPGFQFVDQDGVSYTADVYPTPTGKTLTGAGQGTLSLVADGGAGPAVVAAGEGGLAPLVAPITPGRATNAVDVTVAAPAGQTVLLGAPQLTITYSGTVPDGDRPTRVFAQLVDDATGIVLGNQITPIQVVLDGQPHSTSVPLEMIAFTAHPGSTVTLQLVATTVSYAVPRLGGTVDFSAISIDLPIVDQVTPVP